MSGATPDIQQDKIRQESEPALSLHILLRCFFRTWFVGAGWNQRGMQNIGLAFAMDPGLQALYGSGESLHTARLRYACHYNTHFFWTPLLVGIFLGIEKKICSGSLPAELFENVKGTTVYTLSAIGDSFFGASLLVFWSLITGCFFVAGWNRLALALGFACFLGLFFFKAITFWLGLREDLNFLQRLGRWKLITWGQRCKYVNCILLVCLWALAWPRPFFWYHWVFFLVGIALLAVATLAVRISRELLVALLVVLYLSLPWLERVLTRLF